MYIKSKKINLFLLLFPVLIGSLLRFYKLDWGNGLYAHPDEYHIVASVLQLSFPDQMHPHFFSYGTVTIYLIYFTRLLLEIISQIFPILNSLASLRSGQFLILDPFLIGRFYSAFFSTLTIIIVFKLLNLFSKNYLFAFFGSLLIALTPGLVQQAHFATPESNLTFFILGSMLFLIRFIKSEKKINLFLSSIFLGFALGVKISSIVFLFPLLFVIILKNFKNIKTMLFLIISNLFTVLGTLAIVAPFIFIDYPSFLGNLEYEGGLAAGKFSVFYTRQFINSIPVLFQFEKILPYALGPSILIFGIIGFILILLSFIRKKSDLSSSVILISFLSIFIPNGLLFAKWTRFIAPVFPFFSIFSVLFILTISKKNKALAFVLAVILLTTTTIWSLMFFSIYTKQDIRITASDWIADNLSEKSILITEEGNTIDIPLKGNFKRIGFNFYPLDQDKELRTRVAQGIYQSDYFIVQSRRLFLNHQRLPKLFPRTKKFYDALFDGRLGFSQIKEFASYPSLQIGSPTWGLKLEIPDEKAEETWTVFDHPVIRIFKKDKQFSFPDYLKFLDD